MNKSAKILKQVLDSNGYSQYQKHFKENLSFSYANALKALINTLHNSHLPTKVEDNGGRKATFLFTLFILNKEISLREAREIFSEEELEQLMTDEIMQAQEGRVWANYSIMPYAKKYILTDKFSAKKGRYYVYTGSDSTSLLDTIQEEMPFDLKTSILDIGTGPGTLAIGVSAKARKVIGCDINKRALKLARVNAVLNGMESDKILFTLEDYREILRKQSFDLIVSNPPYLPVPPSMDESFSLCSHGKESGLEFVKELIDEFYKSKSKELILITLIPGTKKRSQIGELFKNYEVKVDAYLLKKPGVYSYIYRWSKDEIESMLSNYKKNNIEKFYFYVLRVRKEERGITIKKKYNKPPFVEWAEEIYFKWRARQRL